RPSRSTGLRGTPNRQSRRAGSSYSALSADVQRPCRPFLPVCYTADGSLTASASVLFHVRGETYTASVLPTSGRRPHAFLKPKIPRDRIAAPGLPPRPSPPRRA